MRTFTIEFVEFENKRVRCNGVWGDKKQASELENMIADKAQILFLAALASIFPENITGMGSSNDSLEDAVMKADIETKITEAGS